MTVPISKVAQEYAWIELLRRAGVAPCESVQSVENLLGVRLLYQRPELPVSEGRTITVVPCDKSAWFKLVEGRTQSTYWILPEQIVPHGAAGHLTTKLPAIFWGAGYEQGTPPFVERNGANGLIVYVDIIASTLFFLTRWEEAQVSIRDEYNRFPASASIAAKLGFLDLPLVDEYAVLLKVWLQKLLPNWKPMHRPFRVLLSHDLDSLRRFPTILAAARTLAGDLMKRHDPGKAWHTAQTALHEIAAPHKTSEMQGIHALAVESKRNNLQSAFYFMAAEKGQFDSGYDTGLTYVRECIANLRLQGHNVGFHAGFDAYNDPEELVRQKTRLDAILGHTRYGGRQHYLRFKVPNTWRHWKQAGCLYDSTMGYHDQEGFRCGTCWPYKPFDIENDRELDIWELPLVAMDVTLKNYRGYTPEQAHERLLILAERCQRVGGVFTLLWHNTSLVGEWAPWAEMYRRLLVDLAQMNPARVEFAAENS